MSKITVDPCKVCGSTDMNLVDGYYYCVECGTQDENVRQTMIEEKALADGTFTFKQKNKFTTIVEEKNELCGEWHKWHAYNFILVGLVNELIAAGAKETFKMKALWLWTEYIKKFQNTDELGLSKENQDLSITEIGEESYEEIVKKKKKQNVLKMTKDVGILKKSTLLSLLYVALNLDGSHIQMSDLMRFIREGRLDINNCRKYIPKEIKVNLIPEWKSFHRKYGACYEDTMVTSISFLKCFSIAPRLPDLKKIVDKFIKELCLPNDFKNLVLSLMQLVPCDYLEVDVKDMKNMVRFPAYECVVMSYVLVAFKMCFGLDDDYEIWLSDVVDKINDDNCYLKSYKLGPSTMPSDRLFSFREWCNFIKLRKIMLSKYYLHMAEQHLHDIDDYVYMEQTYNEKSAQPSKYTDEIIMKLLDKIAVINKVEVVPKSEFISTITPMTTYTELIIEYIKDPDMRLLFSEDFTQYSLKYAVQNLQLQDTIETKHILLGVSDSKKLINSEIYGILQTTNLNVQSVYVRNCDNKNWLITHQPKAEHIKNITKSNDSDKDSDHGYDSPTETISSHKELHCDEVSDLVADTIENEKQLELIVEESTDTNIFDDNFDDIIEDIEIKEEIIDVDKSKVKQEEEVDINETNSFNCSEIQYDDFADEDLYSHNCNDSNSDLLFNPNTFDRDKVIRELVLACCKKNKIRIPKEYDNNEPKKRKSSSKDKTDVSSAKKRRLSNSNKRIKTKTSTARDEVNELIVAYYQNIEHDILMQISEQVKNAITNNETLQPQNIMEPLEDDHAMPNDLPIDNVEINETPKSVINNHILDRSSNVEFLDDNKNSGDPKFDEKEYDIEQLYLKIDGESDSDDPFDIADDPVISEILNRKIEEMENNSNLDQIINDKADTEESLKLTCQENSTAEDSEDEVPLSVIKEEKNRLNEQTRNLESIELEPLVNNHKNIKDFKYWLRNYASRRMIKTHNLNETFYKELEKNFPKSFYFVIRECAMMLETTPYVLYKAMLNLENRLIAF